MWVIECVSFMPAACLGLQRTEDCVNISTGSGPLLWITTVFEPLVVLGPVWPNGMRDSFTGLWQRNKLETTENSQMHLAEEHGSC